KVFNEAALGQVMSLKVRLPATYFARRLRTALLARIGAQGSGADAGVGARHRHANAARCAGRPPERRPERSSARDTPLIDVNCEAAQISTEGIRFVEPIPAPAANLVISIVGELCQNIV